MPLQTLLSFSERKIIGLELKGKKVWIDQAHKVLGVLEKQENFEISPLTIFKACYEIEAILIDIFENQEAYSDYVNFQFIF